MDDKQCKTGGKIGVESILQQCRQNCAGNLVHDCAVQSALVAAVCRDCVHRYYVDSSEII